MKGDEGGQRGEPPSGFEKRFGQLEAALCGRGVNNIFGSVAYESTKLEALGLAKDPPGWNNPNVAIPTVKEAEVVSPANMISFSDSVWRLTPRKDHIEGLLVPPHTGDAPRYPYSDAVQVFFDHPRTTEAVDKLHPQFRSSTSDDDLAGLVTQLHKDDRLVVVNLYEETAKEPRILCSLGLVP